MHKLVFQHLRMLRQDVSNFSDPEMEEGIHTLVKHDWRPRLGCKAIKLIHCSLIKIVQCNAPSIYVIFICIMNY